MRDRKIILFTACLISAALMAGCGNSNTEAYRYEATDVSGINDEALKLYEAGEYKESIEKYLEAMDANPKDTEARMGAIKNLVALEQYNAAIDDINMLIQIDPYIDEAYEEYLEIGELEDDMQIKRNAVSLAKKYNIESVLAKVPATPVIGTDGGVYDDIVTTEMTCEDPDAEIFYTISSSVLPYRGNEKYDTPVRLLSGTNEITAYSVKDGIPSDDVTEEYIVEYEGKKQDFTEPLIAEIVANTLDKPVSELTDVDCWELSVLDVDKLRTDGMSYDDYKKLKIHSLEDLAFMPNLTSLDLAYQDEISSYGPVAGLKALNYMYLTESNISDIGFVSGLPMLSSFYIRNNNVSDLSPLLNCKELSYLDVTDNPVSDISILFNDDKIKIRTISLSVDQITDYSVFDNEDLYDLSIRGLRGLDTEAIGKLKNLTTLDISRDYEKDGSEYEDGHATINTDFLKNMTQLERLYINGIEDPEQVKNLYELKNLTYLSVYNCKALDDADVLDALRNALPKCQINH